MGDRPIILGMAYNFMGADPAHFMGPPLPYYSKVRADPLE